MNDDKDKECAPPVCLNGQAGDRVIENDIIVFIQYDNDFNESKNVYVLDWPLECWLVMSYHPDNTGPIEVRGAFDTVVAAVNYMRDDGFSVKLFRDYAALDAFIKQDA